MGNKETVIGVHTGGLDGENFGTYFYGICELRDIFYEGGIFGAGHSKFDSFLKQ